MPDHSVSKVLESVADVSAKRDIANLRRSLLQTLTELLPVQDARFCPLGASADLRGPLNLRIDAAMTAALRAGQSLTVDTAGASPVLLFPAGRDEMLAVRTKAPTPHPEVLRVVQALLRLHGNFAELITASEQDRLTGLGNRRSFDAYLAQIAEAGVRSPAGEAASHHWLALLDVDHFKRINDRYGHLFGDEVLLLLARSLRQRLRGEDRCFRYGGEEFALVLGPMDRAAAASVMERLRRAIESHPFPQVGQVTISVGCAELVPGVAPLDLIDCADRALYEAKRSGRNRVVFADCRPDRPGAAGDRCFGEVELF